MRIPLAGSLLFICTRHHDLTLHAPKGAFA